MIIIDFHGIVYSATNIINNKRYIGQTVRNLERRKQEHISNANRGGQYAFHQALRKYGEEVFEWEILDTAETIEELDKKEIYWINYYDTYGHGGYNMAVGGQFSKNEYGDLDKLSEQFGGREFFIYDLEGNFIKETRSQKVFAEEIDVAIQSVNNVLVGKKNQVKGYILIFKEEFSEELLAEKVEKCKGRYFKEFYVFTTNNKYIGKWNNQVKCSKDLKIHRSSIGKCLQEKLKSVKGYTFYYQQNLPIGLREVN